MGTVIWPVLSTRGSSYCHDLVPCYTRPTRVSFEVHAFDADFGSWPSDSSSGCVKRRVDMGRMIWLGIGSVLDGYSCFEMADQFGPFFRPLHLLS